MTVDGTLYSKVLSLFVCGNQSYLQKVERTRWPLIETERHTFK